MIVYLKRFIFMAILKGNLGKSEPGDDEEEIVSESVWMWHYWTGSGERTRNWTWIYLNKILVSNVQIKLIWF